MTNSEVNATTNGPARRLGELVLWLAIAAGMWGYSYWFDVKLSTFALGPVAWPRAVLLFIVAAAIISFLMDRTSAPEAPEPAASDSTPQVTTTSSNLQLAAAMGLPLVYTALLPGAGFYATTPFFFFAYMWVLGMRRLGLMLAVTVGFYVLILLVFAKLLYLSLPTGVWPGFYDFSNWLLVRLGSM
ncbi:MAG: tripartite tricarboxylate transporter TctB family protein [Hyphomicrobiaceae bacterium]|nr:tripartite tricarboxylate transporter TctB family protein [Hyphomicrobiaceae bacterium]